MELVADRLKGEAGQFDIVTADGKTIVQKDKRITAKHIRDIQTGPDLRRSASRYAGGPWLARTCVNLENRRAAGAQQQNTKSCWPLDIYVCVSGRTVRQRAGPWRLHFADHARSDDIIRTSCKPGRHLSHDASGEPPTEEAVEALFQRLFFNEDAHDLSRVGRMKFKPPHRP